MLPAFGQLYYLYGNVFDRQHILRTYKENIEIIKEKLQQEEDIEDTAENADIFICFVKSCEEYTR